MSTSETTDQPELSSRLAAFGPNEWLVDEIYQQYLTDKASVDPAWWDFFEGYAPSDHSPVGGRTTSREPATTPVAVPALEPAATPAPSAPTPVDDRDIVILKGPSARVVGNMESSLTVPTATSVRAVPAKLLIDNRVVINNHLARGRGGKVSFTHLIGFAIVRALHDNEAMNFSFAEIDGKPAVVRNHDVNLGLAIDLAKPDGTRQLLVRAVHGLRHLLGDV